MNTRIVTPNMVAALLEKAGEFLVGTPKVGPQTRALMAIEAAYRWYCTHRPNQLTFNTKSDARHLVRGVESPLEQPISAEEFLSEALEAASKLHDPMLTRNTQKQ